jgi:spermidine/putrescine transport system permease protein
VIAVVYVVWWTVPLAVALRASVDAGGDAARPAGLSLDPFREAFQDPDTKAALIHSLVLAGATAAAATPTGASLALSLRRMSRRRARITDALTVLAIATPQVVLGAAMYFAFLSVFRFRLDGTTQFLAHVTLTIPFVTLIVRARLNSMGDALEEMAMDLGASPTAAIRRVVVPLLTPALVASAAVAFALSFDNIVLSDRLCIDNPCRTLPLFLFGRGGSVDTPPPSTFALGVVGLAVSLGALAVAATTWAAARRLTVRTV